MAILTIHLPDDKHERLWELARKRSVSVDRLIEDLATAVLDESDAEVRFLCQAALAMAVSVSRRFSSRNLARITAMALSAPDSKGLSSPVICWI